LFLWGDDRSDMNLVRDPFFDYHGAVLAVIGLIGFIVRPTWLKTFIFGSIWVGIAAHIMTTGDPTSAKLIGAVPSFFLLTAFVLADCIAKFWETAGQKRWMGAFFIIGLAMFWGWAAQGTFERVYVQWFHTQGFNSCLSEAAAQDALDKRVYMGPDPGFGFMSPTTQSVINDEVTVYMLQNENPIYVASAQNKKDVVVILSPRSLEIVNRLKKEFPKAEWTPGWRETQSHQEDPYFYRILITADQIPEKKGKFFQYIITNDLMWTRKLYAVRNGLARGMIQYEDMTPTLNPIWQESGDHSISAEGVWNAPADGDYQFSISTLNVIKFFVDDQTILDLIPKDKVISTNRSIQLKKGPHKIRYLMLVRSMAFSDVTIRNLDTNFSKILGK
ncbi:MAG TPA: hypothetical protein VN963_01040, partial [bacterium]|nr:hypothetical protein [bacterium]